MKKSLHSLVVAVVVTLFSPLVAADAIDFVGYLGPGSLPSTVTLQPYVGGTLSATAPLNELFLTSSPLQHYPITSGLLSFQTAAAGLDLSGSALCPIGTCLVYNPGGSLSITGSIFGLPTNAVLATGSFLNASVSLFGSSGSFSGTFQVTDVNTTMLSNLFPTWGQPIITTGTIGQVFFDLTKQADGTYTGGASSTNLLITIPEPASLLLLGSGLLICANRLRRKLLVL